MSFSTEVKQEITKVLPKKDCCMNTFEHCYDLAALDSCIMGKCCIKTLLRRAFLEFGSINDPANSYHVELVAKEEELASYLCVFLNDYHLDAKIMLRNGVFVVYIKGADAIADFLKLVAAPKALMYFENTRIEKELRENINREMNCESANLQKKLDAAFRQLEAIQKIQKTVGLEYLTPELREIAELRLANHSLGLEEMGALLQKPIGKSGVNHRMRKLIEIAKKI